MHKCTKLAEGDDISEVLTVGASCFLEDIKSGCILANYIKPMYVCQKSICPRPFRALVSQGTQDKSKLAYVMACKSW